MGRAPCCDKVGLKKGRWTDEEDKTLIKYIEVHGEGSWKSLPKKAGLLRCGKSCRLRWINYLRADLKRGNITEQEEDTIVKLHASIGNRWSVIASHLPGRTDNEIKNYWNSHLSRKIYRFYRPGRESCPPPPDILKIPSPCKRGSGRVSRSVAKKFNKNIIESTTEPPASDDTPRGGPLTGVDNLWPNDRENEVMDPFNFEELDEHIAELGYILENGAEDSCGNLNLDVEIENAFVGLEELTENGGETKGSNGGGGSSCDNGETYGLNSGFMIDNEWIDWHLEYAAGPDGGLAPCPEEENNFCLWDKDIDEPGEVWHY